MKKTMSPTIRALACVGLVLTALVPAQRALASWASENCHGSSWVRETWKRSQADNYAMRAVGEGYEFGGGCYKLNGYDDTPHTATDGGGEGADCSGFTFKTWALPTDPGSKVEYRYWEHEKNIHGPYSTWAYFDPATSYPFRSSRSPTRRPRSWMHSSSGTRPGVTSPSSIRRVRAGATTSSTRGTTRWAQSFGISRTARTVTSARWRGRTGRPSATRRVAGRRPGAAASTASQAISEVGDRLAACGGSVGTPSWPAWPS